MKTLSGCGYRYCYLADQRPISGRAYREARRLCGQVAGLVATRDAHLRRTRRDPAIHLPHGNWELGGGLYAAYAAVVAGGYPVINRLRLFSQMFTGHHLMTLAPCGGTFVPRAVPDGLDARLAALAHTSAHEIDYYLRASEHLPPELHVSPPDVFGEVGWIVGGAIVNHDTNAYLERVALLAGCGELAFLNHLTRTPVILEVGPGYGGLAYHLAKIVPSTRHILVDIPESLLFSAIYLTTLMGERDNVLITPDNLHDLRKDTPGFTFVPNHLFDDCLAARLEVDLAINTLSMSEMTEPQVGYYAEGIATLLGRAGVFFEQNLDGRPDGLLDAKRLLARRFPLCLPLGGDVWTRQGAAHLWANAPARPHAWRASESVM